MSWVILTSRGADIDAAATPHKILSSKDYIGRPQLFQEPRPKIINLARSYGYQSRAYYASLLAEARGHRIIPSVETMIDLSKRELYANALPELEEMLNRATAGESDRVPDRLRVYFGEVADKRFERFARLLFDWFRAPALEVRISAGEWAKISRIGFGLPGKGETTESAEFAAALERYTRRVWRDPKQKVQARYTLAALYDPEEKLPPTTPASLKYFAGIAARLGVEIEPIGKRDLAKVANFDGLFIRETTSISNHTYRFARRAAQEGMPVIDDPVSMIRCTNKLYLKEKMEAKGIPVPRSVMLSSLDDAERAADELGLPLVVKIPDSSFSRGVSKANTIEELRALVSSWLEDTDFLLAQEFMPTRYDWRIGVLGGRPLFAVQYAMVRSHWQIIRHDADGRFAEGAHKGFRLADTPAPILDTALQAARCIGDGLYGVDLKETDRGVFVIEINDNPNLEHGVEDSGDKEDVWINLTRWFIDRLDNR
jgi:glutathione synthase/RimK-type ligase-like ATP-grasp enzyme